ncbi:MAG: hypothetical protein J6A10_04545, partial [Peptococcaceae bacterium]|nr:hypothetical protein [Peptococcaceae bacterium]
DTTFKSNAASGVTAACVIEGLEAADRDTTPGYVSSSGNTKKGLGNMAVMPPRQNLIIDPMNQGQMGSHRATLDVAYSTLKPANGWDFEIPADALEFTILFSGGLLRRPALLLKNENGVYDNIAIYKNKKDNTALSTAKNKEYVRDYMDVALEDDGTSIDCNRDYCIFDIDPEGKHVRMWVSAALDYNKDSFWHPQSLLKTIRDNVGCPPPTSNIGSQEKELISDVNLRNWFHIADWQADSIHYMLDKENVDVVFSHYHAVDLQEHRFIRYMYDKGQNTVPVEQIHQYM